MKKYLDSNKNVEILIKMKNIEFSKKKFRDLLLIYLEEKVISRRSNIREKQKNEIKEFLIENKLKMDY